MIKAIEKQQRLLVLVAALAYLLTPTLGRTAPVCEDVLVGVSLIQKLGPVQATGGHFKIVMAAVELGEVQGLKTDTGQPLNIKAGGVSVVLDDMSKQYPELLKTRGGELTIVGVLMDNMSREGLIHKRTIKVRVDGKFWDVGLLEYRSPTGAKYIFLDNPSFKRFTATPTRQGESVYTLRGLEADGGRAEDVLEKQRIWSAINQSIATVFAVEQGDIYLPHDSHVSPASFYIRYRQGLEPAASKPLIHNEAYVGAFSIAGENYEQVRRIWNLSRGELDEFFRQGDELVMLAPAVRAAERHELLSAYSVSDGTAYEINSNPAAQRIDFFGRVEGLTNGLSEQNRPQFNEALKATKKETLAAQGITHPEVQAEFLTRGFQFGFPGQNLDEIIETKARAKTALQKNLGLELAPEKPLFVLIARLVYQKGTSFAISNIEHILNQGGQVVIGGPVGDEIGVRERDMLLDLADRFQSQGSRHAKNFAFIDGFVRPHMKALMLAASDFFLVPSRYEPCGLTDAEALYMGSIPIAHNVGGLGKGKNTLLYGPVNRDDQGWQLGAAINEAFRLYSNRDGFHWRQLDAMREDFSWQKNLEKFLTLNRIEAINQQVIRMERLVASGEMKMSQARWFLRVKFNGEYRADLEGFANALKLLHPDRRTPLQDFVLTL